VILAFGVSEHHPHEIDREHGFALPTGLRVSKDRHEMQLALAGPILCGSDEATKVAAYAYVRG
jgi:hypothetical protein